MNRLLLISVFLLVSCASVDHARYKTFNETVSDLADRTELVLQDTKKLSREAAIRKLADGKEVKPSELRIQVREFNWDMEREPTYIKIQRIEQNLVQLNSLFSSYSALLLSLASSEQEDTKTFSELAGKLNANASKLLKTAGSDVETKSTGILSAAAITGFEAFLSKKREKYLLKAIGKNQQYVSDFVSHMVVLVDLIKELKVKMYNDNFTAHAVAWVKSPSKKESSKDIFDLNDGLVVQLETLKLLRDNLSELPEIHATLQRKSSDSLKARIAYVVMCNESLS